MTTNPVLHFAIQPLPSVVRDTFQNRLWIGGFVLFVVAFVVASTLLIHRLESGQSLDWLSSFYFTVINVTTVGFGDIVPKSGWGKLLAIINSVVGVLSFGFLVAVIAAALQPAGYNGVVIQTDAAAPAEPNLPDPNAPIDFGPFKQETLRFLSSLGALLGDPEQRHREARIRFRLSPVDGERPDTTIEIDVFVHHWSK